MSDQAQAIRQNSDRLAGENTVGELMEIVINACRNLPSVWPKLDEAQQAQVIMTADERIRAAMRDYTSAVAGGGFTRIPATIEKIAITAKGMSVPLVISKDVEGRHTLWESQGSRVTLVLTSADAFADAPHGQKADSTQRELPLGSASTLDAVAEALGGADALDALSKPKARDADDGIDPADEADLAEKIAQDKSDVDAWGDKLAADAKAHAERKASQKKVPGRTPSRKGRG